MKSRWIGYVLIAILGTGCATQKTNAQLPLDTAAYSHPIITVQTKHYITNWNQFGNFDTSIVQAGVNLGSGYLKKQGTPTRHLVLVNEGGPAFSKAVEMDDCAYIDFIFWGSADPYGLIVDAVNQGWWPLEGKSHDITMIGINQTGGVNEGFTAKIEANDFADKYQCDTTYALYVQRNIRFSNCKIRNNGGESFYINSTGWASRDQITGKAPFFGCPIDNNNRFESVNTVDTITNTGTVTNRIYLNSTFAALNKTLTFRCVVAKISGTISGSIILSSSPTGSVYTGIQTQTLTNVASNTYIFNVASSTNPYFKIDVVTSGTMKATLASYSQFYYNPPPSDSIFIDSNVFIAPGRSGTNFSNLTHGFFRGNKGWHIGRELNTAQGRMLANGGKVGYLGDTTVITGNKCYGSFNNNFWTQGEGYILFDNNYGDSAGYYDNVRNTENTPSTNFAVSVGRTVPVTWVIRNNRFYHGTGGAPPNGGNDTITESPSAFFSQYEMTPTGGQPYDEFYWLNSNNALLTKTSVTFPSNGTYRCDVSAYRDAGTPNISVSINGVVVGSFNITATTPAIYSVSIPNVVAGTYTVVLKLTNFNSAANYGKIGLVYFTKSALTQPPVRSVITPLNFTMGSTMIKANHFGSGFLRGFDLGSNGYNVSNANGGNKQAMIDMVSTGANIARCFVEVERPGTDYQFKAGELEKLDTTIIRAARYGYLVVPCMYLDPALNTDYWGNPARQTQLAVLWKTIVNRCIGNKYVAAYDLINEPRQNFNYAEVIKFQMQLIDTIRTLDPTHVVLIECISNDMFAMMLPVPYTNVVYSPHGYSTLKITHQGIGGGNVRNVYPTTVSSANLAAPWGKTQLSAQHDDVRTMSHRFNVPIFIGEFSCINWSPINGSGEWTSTKWTDDNISLLEAEQWSWAYHAWRGDYPGWEAEIPSSYYNAFTFVNATPQGLPGYTTWVSNRSSTAPTITMLERYFLNNTAPDPSTQYALYPGQQMTTNNIICNNIGVVAIDKTFPFVYSNNCSVNNLPPVCNPGNNVTLTLPPQSSYFFTNASASDPDGTIASYAWTLQSGGSYTIDNASILKPTVSNLQVGTYTFTLTVTDNLGATASKNITITVNAAANIKPNVNAGSDVILTLPTNFYVISNASASDPDGSISSYLWTKVSGGTAIISDPTILLPTISGLAQGTYLFALTVTDNGGLTNSDTMQIIVNHALNQPPICFAGNNAVITLPLSTYTFSDATASDPDGSIVAYRWTLVSGSTYTINDATILHPTVSNLLAGTYTFRLRVTDDSGATANSQVTIVVNNAPNVPPICNAGNDTTLKLPTSTYQTHATASDVDGSIVSYLWTKFKGGTATISNPNILLPLISNLNADVYGFSLTVTDNNGATFTDTIFITVLPPDNIPPTCNAGGSVVITLPTNSYQAAATANDPDGIVTAYSWTELSGGSYTISNASILNPLFSQLSQGVYVFKLTVTDNSGATASSQLTITVNHALNVPPSVNAGLDGNITLPNSTFQITTASASDADGIVVSTVWTKLSGSTYTINNPNILNPILSNLQQGVYVFILSATDDSAAVSRDTMTIVVNHALNIPPIVSAGNDTTIQLPATTVNLRGTASDPDGTIIASLWANTDGCTITDVSSLITTATCTTTGTHQFTLTVTDDSSISVNDNKSVIVFPAINVPPTAIAANDTIVYKPLDTLVLTQSGIDPDGTITGYLTTIYSSKFSPTVGNETTTTPVIRGLQSGDTIKVLLRVSDNNNIYGYDTTTIIVRPDTVNHPPVPVVVRVPNTNKPRQPIGTVVLDASQSYDNDPGDYIASFVWTQVSGDNTVIMSGANGSVLTLTNLKVGDYSFLLTINDSKGAGATQLVTLTVYNAVRVKVGKSKIRP